MTSAPRPNSDPPEDELPPAPRDLSPDLREAHRKIVARMRAGLAAVGPESAGASSAADERVPPTLRARSAPPPVETVEAWSDAAPAGAGTTPREPAPDADPAAGLAEPQPPAAAAPSL
ncbi:MAG: hypothetical protein D6731_26015, partial [Planctomycetota bacterium]